MKRTDANVPPICALCTHAWPVGLQVLCHCPVLVERFGHLPVCVMRNRDDACGDAQHRAIPLPYIEH